MTQTELAHAVGVAPAYVSQIESSLRVPSLRVARKIADVLHIELPVLLTSTAERPPRDGLSDPERLEMLRTLARGVEQDLESRPVREDVERYPGSKGARLSSTAALVVRSYAFRNLVAASHLHVHPGDETAYCACGHAWVCFEDAEHALEPGDLFRFDASRPHVLLGAEGTVVVSTASPPPTHESLRAQAAAEGDVHVSGLSAGAARGVGAG